MAIINYVNDVLQIIKTWLDPQKKDISLKKKKQEKQQDIWNTRYPADQIPGQKYPLQSYYVKADGSDLNNGKTNITPFKTLRKALYEAQKGTIKTITVIGILNVKSEIPPEGKENSIFIIKDSGSAEITITGKDQAMKEEQGILSGVESGKRVIWIEGNSRLRFEHVEISGGVNQFSSGGIAIIGANVIFGEGVLVQGNHSQSSGGGMIITDGGTLTMQDNAAISSNTANNGGGGVGVSSGGKLIMQDNAAISDNTANNSGGGGVFITNGGTLTMHGRARISNNRASGGGGGIVTINGGMIIMQDRSLVSDNRANGGGGMFITNGGTLTMQGHALISNNRASGGGGVFVTNGGTLAIQGHALISGNIASGGGGLVIINGASLTIQEHALISKNKANSGGGVYIDKSGHFFQKGGRVLGNQANPGADLYQEV